MLTDMIHVMNMVQEYAEEHDLPLGKTDTFGDYVDKYITKLSLNHLYGLYGVLQPLDIRVQRAREVIKTEIDNRREGA